jgi:undecaprenyl-diphosphatase
VIALVIFGLIVGGELLLKRYINRPRPFSRDQNIKMLQPQKPLDPSFPSGDVLRIWYLIVITGTLLGDQGTYWAGLIILALLVSLGRLIMGVHYLSDVLAGAGLGLLGAGTTIWLWQYFHML